MRRGTSPSRSCDEEAAVTPNRELEDPADELLTGSGLPLWQRVGATLGLVAVLVALVLIKVTGSSGNPDARPGPSPAPTVTFDRPTRPPQLSAAKALDVIVDGDTEWTLSGTRLSRLRGGEVVRTVRLGFLHFENTSRPLLALDRSRDILWLVVANAVPTRMIEFDSRTLVDRETLTWRQLVYGAAALDGYLYLANDLGVAEVSPTAMVPRFVAGLGGAIGPIAVDELHHQLLAVDESNPTGVWSYRQGHRPQQAPTRLAIGDGTVAVADGQVWVGGFSDHGAARLYRLDPRTLTPVDGGRAPEFDPGAVVMSAGSQVIWVRDGVPSSDLFACLDAATGRVEQRFHLAGVNRVASTVGAGVVATDQGVLPLTMGGCAG